MISISLLSVVAVLAYAIGYTDGRNDGRMYIARERLRGIWTQFFRY